jgi:hypothetical protein
MHCNRPAIALHEAAAKYRAAHAIAMDNFGRRATRL